MIVSNDIKKIVHLGTTFIVQKEERKNEKKNRVCWHDI